MRSWHSMPNREDREDRGRVSLLWQAGAVPDDNHTIGVGETDFDQLTLFGGIAGDPAESRWDVPWAFPRTEENDLSVSPVSLSTEGVQEHSGASGVAANNNVIGVGIHTELLLAK